MAEAKKPQSKTQAARAKAQAAVKNRATTLKEKGAQHGGGFMNFVREQGVVGLAVGLAIGTAAGAAVKQIVDGLINPIVGFMIGGLDLANLSWTIVAPNADGKGGLVLGWGAVVSALITLIATALVVYWAIHAAKLDRLDKKKG